MGFTAIFKGGHVYVTVTSGKITAEQDALDLIAACMEHNTNLLLLPAACLSEEFLRLSTRVAGLVLQKLGNYHIKTVAVLDAAAASGHLREFLSETNRGRSFRAYATLAESEA